MKTGSDFTRGILLLVMLALMSSAVWAEEEDKSPQEVNVMGPYIEFGPTFFVPVGNRQIDNPRNADDNIFKVGLGGGGQFAAGYDTKWVGLGTKLRMEVFQAERPSGGDTGVLYEWDIAELRLFVLDWFRQKPGKLRPYLLAGAGYNLNSGSIIGAQANFGAGVQYQLSDHLYVGLEGTYRHLILDENVPSLATAATVGFRF